MIGIPVGLWCMTERQSSTNLQWASHTHCLQAATLPVLMISTEINRDVSVLSYYIRGSTSLRYWISIGLDVPSGSGVQEPPWLCEPPGSMIYIYIYFNYLQWCKSVYYIYY